MVQEACVCSKDKVPHCSILMTAIRIRLEAVNASLRMFVAISVGKNNNVLAYQE